jgi:threonine dehydratase
LEYSSELSGAHSTDVYLKLEVFQPIRVFKLRGALNKVLCLSGSSLRKGVITASSGNHGLAVAYVSRMFDVQSVICVPITSNPQKLSAIRECGARVVQSGSNYDEAFQTALSLARREGLTFIHAFDDPDVIAGQGTCGLEIAAQAQHIDFVFVPIGGGGLISGVATALKSILENVTVIGVQTAVVHSMYDSLKAGKRVTAIPRASIADGMMALTPGVHTFGLVRKYVDRIVLVSDNQMKSAIVELIRSARIMVEPAGAAPLAALKKQRPVDQGRVVLLVSGGNISQSLLGEVTCSDQIVSRTRRIRAQ